MYFLFISISIPKLTVKLSIYEALTAMCASRQNVKIKTP